MYLEGLSQFLLPHLPIIYFKIVDGLGLTKKLIVVYVELTKETEVDPTLKEVDLWVEKLFKRKTWSNNLSCNCTVFCLMGIAKPINFA